MLNIKAKTKFLGSDKKSVLLLQYLKDRKQTDRKSHFLYHVMRQIDHDVGVLRGRTP